MKIKYLSSTDALPALLALVFIGLALWSGIAPADHAVWYAEMLPVLAVFVLLLCTFRRFRFSNTAYVLMACWLFLHTVGARYTFADVPFEWGNRLLSPLLGEGRNHFDRFAHYIVGKNKNETRRQRPPCTNSTSGRWQRRIVAILINYIIGFYAFPMAEWLLRRGKCTFGTAMFFGLFFVMSVAAAYEIIEWQYAVIEGGQAGIEFLGSQGDVWDAQKDMLADTFGALTALALFACLRPDLSPATKT